MEDAVPGRMRVGLKVAVAAGGIPEEVRRMGLDRVPFWVETVKV